jgi:hypothetical protein
MQSIVLLATSALLASTSFATTITATSATGNLKDSGSAKFEGKNLTGKETINWKTGEDAADGKQFCSTPCNEGSEPKFDPGPKPGTFAGRKAFQGFNVTFTGDNGSISNPSGEGSSTVGKCSQFNDTICGTATWTVHADGMLGKDTTLNRSWITRAEGSDPWPFSPSDFAGFGSTYDLWTPAGLDALDVGPMGAAGLDVQYQTAAGFVDLLDISFTSAGAVVQGSSLPGIQYYQLSDINQGPTFDPSLLLTAAQIQSMLNADMAGGQLLSPFLIGIYTPNLSVPTVALADGSVAAIDVNASAFDQASAPGVPTPEPSTWVVGLGAALVFIVRRRPHSR